MIYYSPLDGNVVTNVVEYTPRTCFVMTQLGGERSEILEEIISKVKDHLELRDLIFNDASFKVTGGDFLDKIWKMSLGCPIGIAILEAGMTEGTLSNIFFELGLLASQGKEIVVIKCADFKIPSDFIRTEYIKYDEKFSANFDKFIDNVFQRGSYYGLMAETLEAKPLLSLDYLRRAYLITGEVIYREKAKEIVEQNNFDEHTRIILSGFIHHG